MVPTHSGPWRQGRVHSEYASAVRASLQTFPDVSGKLSGGHTELGNNSLEPRFAGNSRNQVSVNRVTGDTVNRVTGDMVTF